ncbi:MAG TPA: LysR family transcriptional regulator [Thermoanaerobaculia bacterium]
MPTESRTRSELSAELSRENAVRPRIRVLHGSAIALGPGKAELLAEIERDGTLAGAARRLGMSYSRAWHLLQTMNACFREPLVATARGGNGRGQASLTPTGRAALDLYRRMERDSLAALAPAWRELATLLAGV